MVTRSQSAMARDQDAQSRLGCPNEGTSRQKNNLDPIGMPAREDIPNKDPTKNPRRRTYNGRFFNTGNTPEGYVEQASDESDPQKLRSEKAADPLGDFDPATAYAAAAFARANKEGFKRFLEAARMPSIPENRESTTQKFLSKAPHHSKSQEPEPRGRHIIRKNPVRRRSPSPDRHRSPSPVRCRNPSPTDGANDRSRVCKL